MPSYRLNAVSWPRSAPDPPDIQGVLHAIELHEIDEVCDNDIVVVETGLDRSTVDTVLGHLWLHDRIECRACGWVGFDPIMTSIRLVIPDGDGRWG
jgi:hypothetical protein